MNADMQQVLVICAELERNNKKPSVGLIKAKSPVPLPIPLIIKALSYWKENKQALLEKGVEIEPLQAAQMTEPEEFSKKQRETIKLMVDQSIAKQEQKIKQLESALNEMHEQVKVLQQQLSALVNQ